MSTGASRTAPGFVSLGQVCRDLLGMQAQYGARYAGGWSERGYPDLTQPVGERGDLARSLRTQGVSSDYHSMLIHSEDAVEFARRVLAHQMSTGALSPDQFERAAARLRPPISLPPPPPGPDRT